MGGSDALSGVTPTRLWDMPAIFWWRRAVPAFLPNTEIYGAEHLLTRRAVDEATVRLVRLIDWWQDYTARNRGPWTTIPAREQEGRVDDHSGKSWGAGRGNDAADGCYKYAEPVTARGFTFMDSPGYDPASVTGQIASGCNLVTFTTGRGSAFGSKPSPCIKIATNTEMYERLISDMDINAGAMLTEGQSLEEKGREIYEMLLAVASGAPSKSEAQGLGDYEFVPWQIGATM